MSDGGTVVRRKAEEGCWPRHTEPKCSLGPVREGKVDGQGTSSGEGSTVGVGRAIGLIGCWASPTLGYAAATPCRDERIAHTSAGYRTPPADGPAPTGDWIVTVVPTLSKSLACRVSVSSKLGGGG